LLALALSVLCASSALAEGRWKEIERIDRVWRNATLIVEGIPNATVDDRSPHMRIMLANGMTMVASEGGLVPLKEGLIFNKGFARHNLLMSKYAALLPAGKGHAPLLFVLGRAYASDPGSLHVIGLDRKGQPTTLLALEIFEPSRLVDLDGDGSFELVGNPSYSQSDGPCMKTYDPFAVYTFYGSELGYSLSLSEAYNRKHYYGWAGRDAREDIRIITCGKNKGRIVSAQEAKKLAR
jgi:hypothetical protein